MLEQSVFDFRGKHVLASPDNHILYPAGDFQIALIIHTAQISGVQPTVCIDSFTRRLGVVVVTDHVAIGPDADFPYVVDRQHLLGFDAADAHFGLRQRLADGVANILDGIIGEVLCDYWRRFCLSVKGPKPTAEHLFNIPHQLRGNHGATRGKNFY